MKNPFSALLERNRMAQAVKPIDQDYVSEYTRFIEHFISEHPEIRQEQHDGWRTYWDKRGVDVAAQQESLQASVPDDGYGFYYSAWKARKGISGEKDRQLPNARTIHSKKI